MPSTFSLHLRLSLKILSRSNFINFLAVSSVIIIILVFGAAEFSGRQPATVGLDIGFSFIKICTPIAIALCLQELISKELDKRLYLNTLSYPISRQSFILSRTFAALIASTSLVIVLSAILWLIAYWLSGQYNQSTPIGLSIPFLVSISTFLLEQIPIIAISVFFAITSKTQSFVMLSTIGITIAGRSFLPIVNLINSENQTINFGATYSNSLEWLGFIIPELSRFDIRIISLYNNISLLPGNTLISILTALLYSSALFSLSIILFDRKHFN